MDMGFDNWIVDHQKIGWQRGWGFVDRFVVVRGNKKKLWALTKAAINLRVP
jgi:hypothetical protein